MWKMYIRIHIPNINRDTYNLIYLFIEVGVKYTYGSVRFNLKVFTIKNVSEGTHTHICVSADHPYYQMFIAITLLTLPVIYARQQQSDV